MATSVNITYDGPPVQRHVAKVGAMTPISSLLAEACAKFKPPLDPSKSSITLNKKPVDVSLPFRLANIPGGSTLVLHYSDEAAHGPMATKPAIVPHSAAPAAAAAPVTTAPAPIPVVVGNQVPVVAAAAAAVHGGSNASGVQGGDATMTEVHAEPDPSASAAAEPAGDADPPAAASSGSTEVSGTAPAPEAATIRSVSSVAEAAGAGNDAVMVDLPLGTSGTCTAAPEPASTAPTDCEAAAAPVSLELGRPVMLFTRQALEEAHAGEVAAAKEEGEEFFELTPEDYALVMRANERKKHQAESGLKTRALREAEERDKAERYGPVAVRVHLPGDIILQTTFAATETVGAVHALVAGMLTPAVRPAMYLYTTPPRALLKDMEVSLYRAQLVPAAHVHVGLDEKKLATAGSTGQPVIRAEVQAQVASSVSNDALSLPTRARPEAPGAASGAGGSSAARSGAAGHHAPTVHAAGASTSSAAGAKAPKWMKLGPK